MSRLCHAVCDDSNFFVGVATQFLYLGLSVVQGKCQLLKLMYTILRVSCSGVVYLSSQSLTMQGLLYSY